MKKKLKIFLSIVLIITIMLSGGFLIKNTLLKTKDSNLINISYLSEDFMDNYYEEISAANSDKDKENMLIVISNTKIKNSYGAKNIIEAPNNQYILQFDSKKDKDIALNKLKDDNSINSVEENNVYKVEKGNYNSWGIEKTALDHAITSSNLETLKNVTVAVIDTGCDLTLFNKYYGGKITETYNVLEKSTTNMQDEDGHGTHVSGTIAEATPSNIKILPIKVSRNGSMYYTDIIAAINYIVHYEKADVINMSFGGYGYNQALEQAIESANEKNIISVAAAGNDNTNKKHYPSALDNTISIASVDQELKKSSFSNYGAEVTFAAPGTNIKSLMGKEASISKKNGNTDDDDHETISGTSMATPHAVSAVAILKSYNKNLTLTNVIDLLKQNSIDLGEQGWDQYFGYGLISFNDVQFCDSKNCDEYGVYKNKNLIKDITNIELSKLNLTKYNYYSLTNLMGSKVNVSYTDGTSEELLLKELPNLEILNYVPTEVNKQNVTIKTGNISVNIEVTNPSNYESGWKYNTLESGEIELTGYKNHGLEIDRLYIPETIDSKKVIALADNVKFNELGNDFQSYSYLYLPDEFNKIGDYSLSNTKIKYVYGNSSGIEIGNHGLESSSIISFNVPITKVGDYAFKDCFNLLNIDILGNGESNTKKSETSIGEYAFYNCKKLMQVTKSKYDTVYTKKIGRYAFYNCVSLGQFELIPYGDIEEYAFYNCFLLYNLDLYQSDSIGEYAFYGSGISKVNFSTYFDTVSKSAFENCRNLKSVSFVDGRIETRAFWNSNVESIFIGNRVEYIAEDAFAYTPMKTDDGSNNGTGNYSVVHNLGIVENSTNKLLVGFTDALGASNTKIPDYITEIGNYAFTGNNNLTKITIPDSVTKIGEKTFKDCYHLSDVYMLSNNITFDNETFKRTYEGDIQDSELIIYVHKNSPAKQFVANKKINYRHIEPDEIIVTNNKTAYKVLEQVDINNITVKLIYHEEKDREEVLTPQTYTSAPLSDKIGFSIAYQNGYEFQYGDTYYTVNAINKLGYKSTKNVDIVVKKETPEYTIPTNLTANLGQKLSEITLPSGFEWMNSNQTIDEVGDVIFKAKYIPTDTEKYEIVENIDITISVNSNKKIVTPNITLNNKIYDGTTTIETKDISISNLNTSEYSVISATSSSANAGEKTATIKLKLSDEKFKEYSFDNGKQEKEFTVNFEILKANLDVTDSSKDVTVKYDGLPHSIKVYLEYTSSVTIKYMDENGEYTLDKVPEYTAIGTYITKYKVYTNDNYTEYFGQRNLTIENTDSYVINNYSVDETNKYINRIIINTELNTFTSNVDLSSGYGIDVDYKEIDDKKLLYTGGKTRIMKDLDLFREYTNIVIGDINGDGAINSADLLKIRQHLLETKTLSGAYFLASDINDDNTINSADLLRIRQHLLGAKPIK